MADAKPSAGVRAWEPALAATLFVAFVLQALVAARRTSLTYDEHTYIPAGYTYLAHRDFRLNREHPPLAKLVAALPLVTLPLQDSNAEKMLQALPEHDTSMGQWAYGEELLFGKNLPLLDDVIERARAAMLAFPLLWLSVIYVWSRRLFGAVGALTSLLTAAFSPDVLGHGSLAVNDVPLASLFLATTYVAWRYLRSPAPRGLVFLGVSLGAALATKFTALLLLPTLAVLALAAWLDPALIQRGRPATFGVPLGEGTQSARLLYLTGALALTLPLVVATVAATYLFVEPPAAYIEGLRSTYALVRDDFEPFLFGEYRPNGFWYYFLAALAVKVPLAHWALLVLAVIVMARGSAALGVRRSTARFDLLCVVFPALVVMLAVSAWAAQIGHRYAFPAYGSLFIGVGATGKLVERAGHTLATRRWIDALAGVLVAALSTALAASSVRAAPFYLSYANELVSSPTALLEMFDMGVVDWKQGWREVARLQRSGQLPDVGMYVPERLPRSPRVYGIRHAPIELDLRPPAPATYVFSSNDYFRARHANRVAAIHVPMLEDYPFDVIAGCVVAVRVDERLPEVPTSIARQVEDQTDDNGRRILRQEYFVDADGRKVLHGKYTTWLPDGTREVGSHRMGEIHGSYVRYRADGSASEVGTMWRGRLHGYATRFDPKGHQVGKWRYIGGVKVVRQ